MRVITIDSDTGKRVYSRKELAELCGISTQTVRSWEDRGYIKASIRDDNGYRYWYEEDAQAIINWALGNKWKHKDKDRL